MAHINFGIQKNTHTQREKEDNSMAFDCKSKQSSEMLKNESTPKSMAKMRMTAFATHTHKNNKKKRNKRRFKFIVIRWTIIKLSDFWFCSNPHQQQRTEQSASVSMCERAQMKSITAIMACLVEQRAYFDGWNKYKGNWWLTTEERVKLFRIPVCVLCCLSVDLMHD